MKNSSHREAATGKHFSCLRRTQSAAADARCGAAQIAATRKAPVAPESIPSGAQASRRLFSDLIAAIEITRHSPRFPTFLIDRGYQLELAVSRSKQREAALSNRRWIQVSSFQFLSSLFLRLPYFSALVTCHSSPVTAFKSCRIAASLLGREASRRERAHSPLGLPEMVQVRYVNAHSVASLVNDFSTGVEQNG